ncbi:hypothetical protein OC844_007771, partial [Tilletia horrida]
MAVLIPRPRGRDLAAMRPEVGASHPLGKRLINPSEFIYHNLDWTFAALHEGEWRPLGAHDAHRVLLPPAADNSFSFRPKEDIERQPDLRLECAHRHRQVFSTDTIQGMRSHLRAHDHPSARAKLSKTQLAGYFLRALFCLFVLAAMTVEVMAF